LTLLSALGAISMLSLFFDAQLLEQVEQSCVQFSAIFITCFANLQRLPFCCFASLLLYTNPIENASAFPFFM
jgi:hypothetical protein